MAVAGGSENNTYLSNIKVLSEDKYNALSSTPDNVLHFVELPMDNYIVESYQNGDRWYRVWSDGIIEQGGYEVRTAASQIVSFTINYSNPPQIQLTGYHTASLNGSPLVSAPSETKFTMITSVAYTGVYWYAIGR